MQIQKIKESDNKKLEELIRSVLIEYNANRDGCAWSDPLLGEMSTCYRENNEVYYVVYDGDKLIAGCGIGQIEGYPSVCELQKLYCSADYRGQGIGKMLMDKCLLFASEHYDQCYLETFLSMSEANRLYIKYGFELLTKPLYSGEHNACDGWYIKTLKK